jgi:hypothetical protein
MRASCSSLSILTSRVFASKTMVKSMVSRPLSLSQKSSNSRSSSSNSSNSSSTTTTTSSEYTGHGSFKFDDHSAVTRVEGSDTSFKAFVTGAWSIMNAPNGGYLTAVAISAAREVRYLCWLLFYANTHYPPANDYVCRSHWLGGI